MHTHTKLLPVHQKCVTNGKTTGSGTSAWAINSCKGFLPHWAPGAEAKTSWFSYGHKQMGWTCVSSKENQKPTPALEGTASDPWQQSLGVKVSAPLNLRLNDIISKSLFITSTPVHCQQFMTQIYRIPTNVHFWSFIAFFQLSQT